MSKLANFENRNDANSVRIQTLINFNFDNFIVNIMQNIDLMNHLDKIGSSDNSNCFSFLQVSIKNKFSVIGISETWLAHSNNAVDIDGYNF